MTPVLALVQFEYLLNDRSCVCGVGMNFAGLPIPGCSLNTEAHTRPFDNFLRLTLRYS